MKRISKGQEILWSEIKKIHQKAEELVDSTDYMTQLFFGNDSEDSLQNTHIILECTHIYIYMNTLPDVLSGVSERRFHTQDARFKRRTHFYLSSG
jgi:hypothetical protein